MSDNFIRFLETLDSNSAKYAQHYSKIGDCDYTDCTTEKIEEVILSMDPGSPREITTISYVMSQYVKFLNKHDVITIIQNIDRNKLWEKAKPKAPNRFISHSRFEEICNDIILHEEHNGFYKKTLFKAIYEGIYNDDMSVVKNLRANDIHGTIVTLRPDNGDCYDLEISESLAKDLIEISKIGVWERKNHRSLFYVNLYGEYQDSCFKLEIRKNCKKKTYKDSYYRLLRNISKDYLEHALLPRQLYASGIMYRVCQKLENAGFNAKTAFVNHNLNVEISAIIEEELVRSGYKASVRNFKEYLRGFFDVFFD